MIEQVREQYSRLPDALKHQPNWCIAAPDKHPWSVRADGTFYPASSTDPATWLTFDRACEVMADCGAQAIGFMLAYDAGFTCIDLDIKDQDDYPDEPAKWTPQEQINRYVRIVDAFDSYTERSVSGKGVHIWLWGRTGVGARRDGVEVYSQERFMICTGDVIRAEPIKYNEHLLDLLVAEIRKDTGGKITLVEVQETETDEQVYYRALNASNGSKFSALLAATSCIESSTGKIHGTYTELGYGSQSEADLALLSIFAFYTKSNEQVRRLFRYFPLGQRLKATKNDRYLNYALELIRARQARAEVVSGKAEEIARSYVQKLQGVTYGDVMATAVMVSKDETPEVGSPLPWPPGMVGQIAKYIYGSAPRPVKEVAIIAALGIAAGLCGRAYNYNQSGLNLYGVLVARSGVGKETMHSGASMILSQIRASAPTIANYVTFDEYASGPALLKACSTNSSFVNISGELGRKMKRLAADDRPDGAMATLRTQMTNLYQKSGAGNIAGGMAYSNKDDNVAQLHSIAFSIIGESTPETFFQSLTPSMMEDGFLSRFFIIEYKGDRPPLNGDRKVVMDPVLKQALEGLVIQVTQLNTTNDHIDVYADAEAAQILNEFDLECDKNINRSNDEAIRQMWNRAHLKACRIAACLAACDHPIQPLLTATHANWALKLIRNDITMMYNRITNGDIGSGDDISRQQKVEFLMREYLQKVEISDAYGLKPGIKEAGIITHRYLQMRTSQLAQFRKAPMGAKSALEIALRSMMDSGYIVEVAKERMTTDYEYMGRAYRVVYLPEPPKPEEKPNEPGDQPIPTPDRLAASV